MIAQFYPFEQGPSPHTVLTSYRRNGSSTSGASFGNFTIFAETITECDRADEFRPPGGFASPRSIASARLADLVGPNAVAGHERLDGVGLEHDPEKACPALDAGWVPVFPRDKREAFARRSCSNKKIERDDDSKKSHPALGAEPS